jgi:putative thioredoxin
MGTSITVNQQTFQTEVLDKSHQKPVLVDFFATWCGPCQMLKPMLETLVGEYDFVLAKVDIDENPALAQQYGVSGVPDVRLVMAGEVKPGFVGVLPEPQLRKMLEGLSLKSSINTVLDEIFAQADAGQVKEAEVRLKALLKAHPGDYELALEAANFYLEGKQLDEAEALLVTVPQYEKEYSARARGLQALIELQRTAAREVTSELDQIYHAAGQAALAQDYKAAFEGFLSLVERDRSYQEDAGRRGMLALFDLLGNDHALVTPYRKRLMMLLY